MTLPPTVIDTNVLIAALLSKNPTSPVVRIIDVMLEGGFSYLLSTELLAEYCTVLSRPKIQQLHQLSTTEVDKLLTHITQFGIMREPKSAPAAPDPGDNHLWRLLKTHRNSVLVTGDLRLQDNPPDFASVISPNTFYHHYIT